jgi:folate-binding protein YgfZ
MESAVYIKSVILKLSFKNRLFFYQYTRIKYRMNLYHVPQYCIVRLQGKDVCSWLHRLLTIHVKQLQACQISWSYLLNAQGKIQSAFELLTLPYINAEESNTHIASYNCIVWRDHAQEFIQKLDMFLFTEDVEMTILPYECIRIHTSHEDSTIPSHVLQVIQEYLPSFPKQLPTRDIAPTTHETSRLALSADSCAMSLHDHFICYDIARIKRSTRHDRSQISQNHEYDIWAHSQSIQKISASLKANHSPLLSSNAYHALHTYLGIPSISYEYQSRYSAIDFGTHGIDDGKGCYPGQEVIERSIALGRAARKLIHLKSTILTSNDSISKIPEPFECLTSIAHEQMILNDLSNISPQDSLLYAHAMRITTEDTSSNSTFDPNLYTMPSSEVNQSKSDFTQSKPIGHLCSVLITQNSDQKFEIHALALVRNKKEETHHFYSSWLQQELS